MRPLVNRTAATLHSQLFGTIANVTPEARSPLPRQANPEQSKHLETARMKIMGIWVDLVNLRTEIYRSSAANMNVAILACGLVYYCEDVANAVRVTLL